MKTEHFSPVDELPVLGPHFVVVRWVVSLLVTVAVGLLVPLVLRDTRQA